MYSTFIKYKYISFKITMHLKTAVSSHRQLYMQYILNYLFSWNSKLLLKQSQIKIDNRMN
jgi:hypothetical protein